MDIFIGIVIGFGLAVFVGYLLQERARKQADKFYETLGMLAQEVAKEAREESTVTIELHHGTYFAYRKHDMKFLCQFTNKQEMIARLREIDSKRTWLTDEAGLALVKEMK